MGTTKTLQPAAARTRDGFGRLLILIYAIFALAATARATVQLLREWHEAPLAYLLSAVAAVLYIVATIALALDARTARIVAWVAVLIEFAGVLAVGIISFASPELFPKATVWSHLGEGYGFVPLVLPILGLWWLWHTRARSAPTTARSTS